MGTNRGRHEPLTVSWELETIGGEEGAALARRQADVMLEVLAWIVEQRRKQAGCTAPEQG
ncbi:hypothetical protein ACQEVY_03370 [Streptomyces sp. CA-288835]|uniref:hypothetical protein n=1 Tax=Streptomyces sp. CA-288835 TaxID=3240069 RepID=UPI003D91F22A